MWHTRPAFRNKRSPGTESSRCGLRANSRESDPRDAGAALCSQPIGAAAGGESGTFNRADYGVADAARAITNRVGGESHAGAHQLEVSIAMPERSDYASLQTRLDEFRAQHIRGAIISLPLESSIAERLVQENPISPVCFLMFRRRRKSPACVLIIVMVRRLRAASLGARPSRFWPAGRSGKLGLCRLRLGSWRETLHRLGVSQAVTVFGDWSAASGWQKPLNCSTCSHGSAPSLWLMTRWH